MISDSDQGENFELSVFSDVALTQQIGNTFSVAIEERTTVTIESQKSTALGPDELNLILTGNEPINGIGNFLDNSIIGNNGDNILDGREGRDLLEGKGGDDTYIVDNRKDKIVEGKGLGLDTVKSTVSSKLAVNVENLILLGDASIKGIGNNLNNILSGNSGKNKIKGKKGKDIIIGGLGRDVMAGGLGDDTFVFKSINDSGISRKTRDTITDFTVGDLIDISRIDANSSIAGDQTFVFIGPNEFTKAGQVRFDKGLLSVNTDGDLMANFQVKLKGVTELFVDSLVL